MYAGVVGVILFLHISIDRYAFQYIFMRGYRMMSITEEVERDLYCAMFVTLIKCSSNILLDSWLKPYLADFGVFLTLPLNVMLHVLSPQ